jgi:hypothetical protein
MRIRHRLQCLEQRAAASRPAGDAEVVEIWIPDNGRGGLPPGRYPCEGTQNVLIIYEPTESFSPLCEAQS